MNTDLDKSEGQALSFNASRRVAGWFTIADAHLLAVMPQFHQSRFFTNP
jgi:hypothetical protein